MPDATPDRGSFDREAAGRIFRRASDLADASADGEAPVRFEEETLIAAASEVGLPATTVRRAIAIERLGDTPEQRIGDRILGQSVVSADDELTGQATAILERIDAWLVDGHHLRRDRLRGGKAEWSKRSGATGAMLRAMRGMTGEGKLGDVTLVSAVAHETGDGSCVVRVSADRRRDRLLRAGGGFVVAAAGTTTALSAAAISAPVFVVGAPIAVVAGAIVATGGRRRAARLKLELERVLESVHDGTDPTRLSSDVMRRVMRGRGPRRTREL